MSDEALADCNAQSAPMDIDDRNVSLSGLAQYMRELRQIPRIAPEMEPLVITRARQGDQTAKQQFIEDRLPYIMHTAIRYHVYAEHEDLLDIAGVANLAVTAGIDRALTKNNPGAYLSGIPIKDHHTSPAEAPMAVSLDEQRADIQYCYLGSLAKGSITETASARREQCRHVLNQLPDDERRVVELHHGIADSAIEQFTDIAQALAISRSTVYRRYYRALKRLGSWYRSRKAHKQPRRHHKSNSGFVIYSSVL